MTRSRTKTSVRRLALEHLDRRDLPAGGGTQIPFGITLNAFGVLQIKGKNETNDIATVAIENDQVRAVLKHRTPPTPNLPNGVVILDQDKSFPLAKVKSVAFYGLDGYDTFTNDTAIKAIAHGYAGDDILTGGSAADLLIGGDGADTLEGRAGADVLRGGTGNDHYVFAPPPGISVGGLGSDTVVEAANLDVDRLSFYALTGPVSVNLGLTSAQTVKPGYLTLTLSDALGLENVDGTAGADKLLGNGRPNKITGFGGNDTLEGSGAADFLWGGDGADELHGGTGNDLVWGNDGPDRLFGDSGNDTVEGGAGDDRLDGWFGSDRVWGDDGNDKVTGGWGDDLIGGGSGHDTVDGGPSSDKVWGGPGDDSVLGGTGTDILFGDDGTDALDGGTGRDTMDGGAGSDGLRADRGDETLSNGERVKITVPGGSPQTDGWSCGPNSASRLLRSYGFTAATYSTLKSAAQQTTIISQYGLGTPPPVLRDIMKKYKANTQLASNADFQSVLDRLGEGRPVLALLGWGEVEVPFPVPWNPFNTEIAPETLHYVCLTGFDLNSGTIFYTDTNGEAKAMSFASFQAKWNWPATGPIYDGLALLGVKKRTMLW